MWYAASGTSEVPDEVQVVVLEAVDVLGRLAEEAGALHRFRLHQHRR